MNSGWSAAQVARLGLFLSALALVGWVLVGGKGFEVARWIVAVVITIGTLVVIHEFGHFLVARLFGVGTPVFSVGIGPKAWGITLFDTEFRLSWLPIGGYVQMAGADPFGEEDPDMWVEPEKDFMRKPVWQRLLIMLAGPGMNLLLPYLLFTAVSMMGEPVPDAVIGNVASGSAGEAAGLRTGDRVVSVDGHPIVLWSDLDDVFEPGAEHPYTVSVLRDGSTRSVTLPPEAIVERYDGQLDLGFDWRPLSSQVGVPDPASPAARAGLRTGDFVLSVDGTDLSSWVRLREALDSGGDHQLKIVRLGADNKPENAEMTLRADPQWTPVLGRTDTYGLEPVDVYAGPISPGSAAEKAGVQRGDRITSIDGHEILSWGQVIGLVAKTNTGKLDESGEPIFRELELGLVRDGHPLTLRFAPTREREIVGSGPVFRPLMGIGQYPDATVRGETVRKYYPLGEALALSHERIVNLLSMFGNMLLNMFRSDIAVTEAVGGPVAIFRIAGEAAAAGIFPFVNMMGMLSLSLGVMNLLPIPVLDGGQIVFYSVEGIRGRPLPLAWRERIQMVGVLVLAALFVVATVGDLSRLLRG